MTVADHHVVGEVGFAAWKSSDAFDDAYLDPEVITRVAKEFAIFPTSTQGDVHVAELGGEVVGWAARDSARDYISDAWVEPQCQGRGVGRTLVQHLLDLIASEGHVLARIHTHGKNVGAIRLYERCGFAIVWRGMEFSKSMGVDLEKVHLQKSLP